MHEDVSSYLRMLVLSCYFAIVSTSPLTSEFSYAGNIAATTCQNHQQMRFLRLCLPEAILLSKLRCFISYPISEPSLNKI